MNALARQAVRLLAVLAAGAVLVSCGTHDLGTASAFTKDIEVSVQSNAIQPITLVGVPASEPGVIKWIFSSSSATGYVFPDKGSSSPGIVFKIASPPASANCRSTPDPDTVIHNCNAKQRGKEFHCNVKKGTAGSCFAYSVTVVPAPGSSAPRVPTLDPWVRQE